MDQDNTNNQTSQIYLPDSIRRTVAIIGSRSVPVDQEHLDMARLFLSMAMVCPIDDVDAAYDYSELRLISGGAIGADSLVCSLDRNNNISKYCLAYQLTPHLNFNMDRDVFLPDYQNTPGHLAPLERNTLIAREADVIICFWDGKSTGSMDTMKKAHKLGVKTMTYTNQDWQPPVAVEQQHDTTASS